MSRRAEWAFRVVYLLLVGLVVAQALGPLARELHFNADAERDLFEVLAFTELGRAPERGLLNNLPGWDLGPAYFYFLTPFIAFDPSPWTVHLANVVLLTIGLLVFGVGFRKLVGAPATLLVALLWTQSSFHATLLSVAYHVGAASGLGLATVGALAAVIAGGGRGWVIGLVLTSAAFAQVHPLAFAAAPAVLVAAWQARSRLSGRAWLSVAVIALVALAPLLWSLVPTLFRGSADAGHGGELSFAPVELLAGLVDAARSHVLLGKESAVAVTLAAAAFGAVVALSRGAPAERRRAALVMAASGVPAFIALSFLLGFESSGRYFLLAMPYLYGLAGLGLAALPSRATLAMTVALPLLGFIDRPDRAILGSPPMSDELTLAEQHDVVKTLVRGFGYSWSTLAGRVHGAALGPKAGLRYLERIERAGRANLEPAANEHWDISTDAPRTGRDVLETLVREPSGRPIYLTRFRRAFDPGALGSWGQGGLRPCPHVLPFLWNQQPSELLRELGFAYGHGPDVHRCFEGGRALAVPLSALAHSLTADVADDATFRGESADVSFEVVDAQGRSVAFSDESRRLGDRVRHRIDVPEGRAGRHLLFRPASPRLVFLDVY
ncbi:MAG: hypothetical protein IV100_34160 [Myxococcales bacterium]|nr:hypothetical protein [Myxococcales bacterium]